MKNRSQFIVFLLPQVLINGVSLRISTTQVGTGTHFSVLPISRSLLNGKPAILPGTNTAALVSNPMMDKTAPRVSVVGMLIAVSVFAQNPDTKPDKTPQTAPVTQERQPKLFRVSEDIQKAKVIRMVPPLYPPVLGKRIDGTVVLHVVIGEDGSVKSARPVSGPPSLRDAAVSAVLQWKYRQSFMNGEPCEIETTVSVVFPRPAKQEPAPTNK